MDIAFIIVSALLAILYVVAMRYFRLGVAIAYISWVILIGVPLAFSGGHLYSGGHVRTILCGTEPPPSEDYSHCDGSGDFPWGYTWIVVSIVIFAIGVLTRTRDVVREPADR